MNDTKLGQFITGPALRDAIHIAIAPVTAGELLLPGEHVGIDEFSQATKKAPPIGIVDPFIPRGLRVSKGQRFWLCLYQQTVTGMRHHWSHPCFPDAEDLKAKSASEHWLRAFATHAEGVGIPYEDLMKAAKDYLESGESYCFGNDIDYSTNFDEFWAHYRNVTGQSGSGGFFRCAC